MPTGDSVTYISGTGHIAVPRADDSGYRKAHAPQASKNRVGLDWDAIKPTCNSCGTKSSELGPGALCPTCRGTSTTQAAPATKTTQTDVYVELPPEDLDTRFRGPDTTPVLAEALEHLEATDPDVAAAATTYDDMVEKITHPEDHVQAEHPALPQPEPTRPAPALARIDAGLAATNLDAQCTHAARVLRNTAEATEPATRLLRLNALAAIEALHLFHELHHHQTPAETVSTPATAGPQSAAGEEGEASRQPTPPRRPRGDRTAGFRAEMVSSGANSRQIKDWALSQGLITEIHRGMPPRALIDAYVAAHRTTDQSGATA